MAAAPLLPLADGRRRGLVGAVGAALHELQLADVARQGGLRDVEAGGAQPAPQLLLAAHGLVLHGVENREIGVRAFISSQPEYTEMLD
jgi:hypothetical protein